jgi:hypothetical protein
LLFHKSLPGGKVINPAACQRREVPWPAGRNYLAIFLVWGSILALSFRLFWCINRYAVNLFVWDDWIFCDVLSARLRWWQVFLLQDGPHREGVGVLLACFLLRLTSWNSRVNGFTIGIAIVLATVFAVYLKVRLFGTTALSDVIIPFTFLTLAQWEIFLGGPGPSDQAFPLLLTMAYCCAWIQRKRDLRLIQVLVINFLLIFTGFGMFVGAITILLLALECHQHARAGDRKSALISSAALLLAMASTASFFYGYVFTPAADCFRFPDRSPARYLWFVALMFARFVGIKHHLVLASTVGFSVLILLVALLAAHATRLWRKGWDQPASLVTTILIAYSLLYACATSVGRLCFGVEASQSSRYMTLLIPAFLGIYLHLLTQSGSRRQIAALVIVFVAMFSGGIQRNHKEMEATADARRAWKECYLKTENVRACSTSSHLEIYPLKQDGELQKKLQYLKQNRLGLYSAEN